MLAVLNIFANVLSDTSPLNTHSIFPKNMESIFFGLTSNRLLLLFFIVSIFSAFIYHSIKHKYLPKLNLIVKHWKKPHSKKLEKRYRNFAEAEVHGHESERLRVARELHDDTIHRLIFIGQRLELLKLNHPNSEMAQPVDDLIQHTNDGIDHIRNVIKELRPSTLAKMGLIPAIKSLVNNKNLQEKISLGLTTSGTEYRLNEPTELIIYRLAQSAIQNVKLHANCSKADLYLNFEEDQITLQIQDNGVGFDVPNEDDLFEHSHFGLLGMKERTELCGGKFMIHSVKNLGTHMSVEIPRAGNCPENSE